MLPSKRRTLMLAAALTLPLSACADTEGLSPNSDPDPAAQETEGVSADEPEQAAEGGTTDTAEPGGAEESQQTGSDEEGTEGAQQEVEVDEGDEESSWQYVEEFEDPVVWEDAGLRLSVTGIGINDATSAELPAEVSEFLEDDVQTVVVLEMTASNDSGQAVDFYPEQGRIQLLREQAEADMLFSDAIGGFEWPDGVDNDGQVFWMLTRTSFSDAVDAGELTFRVDGAFDSENFDQMTEDVELQITWG